MICPKCNSNIPDKSTYCVRCGSTFNEKGEIINDPDEEKISFDELLKIYVGKKYDKFEDNMFSIWQFLFGPFYSFYRKHYSYGFLCIIVYVSSGYLFNKFLSSIDLSFYTDLINNKMIVSKLPLILQLTLIIAISYLLSRNYNKTYLKYAGTKVKSIMFSKKNYSAETQKKKCIRKGRTSILSIFLGYAIAFIIAYSISFLISFTNEMIKYSNTQNVGKNICTELKEKTVDKENINFNDESQIKIETWTNNKYFGLFYVNSENKIVLLNAVYDDVVCNGICGENVTCKTSILAKNLYK